MFFVHYGVTQLRFFCWNYLLNNFSLLVGLLRLYCFLMVGTYSYFNQDHRPTECRYSYDTCSSTTGFILLHMEQSITYFEDSLFSFSSDVFVYQLDFSLFWPLNLLSSASYVTCFRVSGCFVYFLGCCECWLPCINHVTCQMRPKQ